MAGWGMSVFPRQKNDPIYALTEHAVTAAIERDVRQRKVSKGAAMFAGILTIALKAVNFLSGCCALASAGSRP